MALDMISGQVTRIGDKGGVQLAGGEWYQISKYAEPAPQVPAEGAHVRLGLDGKGFIRTIALLGDAEVGADPTDAHQARPGARSASPAPSLDIQAPDAVSVRLGALQAAAMFLATRADAKSSDVVSVARAFAAWVAQGDGA